MLEILTVFTLGRELAASSHAPRIREGPPAAVVERSRDE